MKPKTIKIHASCQDRFTARLIGENGRTIAQTDPDYVPRDLGVGSSDDIYMEIDIATGQIIGWKPITQETLDEVFKLNQETNE